MMNCVDSIYLQKPSGRRLFKNMNEAHRYFTKSLSLEKGDKEFIPLSVFKHFNSVSNSLWLHLEKVYSIYLFLKFFSSDLQFH